MPLTGASRILSIHPDWPLIAPFPDGRWSDLAIARAQLNGGTAPLNFQKWTGTAYASPGVGGLEGQLLRDGANGQPLGAAWF